MAVPSIDNDRTVHSGSISPRLRRQAPAGLLLLALADSALGMTLGQALERSVEWDPAVAVADSTHAAQAAVGEQERAALRPSLGAQAAMNAQRSDARFAFGESRDQYGSWSAALTARQALWRADWSAIEQRAELLDERADADHAERRMQLIVRVCQRYLDVLLGEDRVRELESRTASVERARNDARLRREVGLVSAADLSEAQAQHDLAEAELATARASLATGRDALQEITGYDRAPLPPLREDFQLPPLDPAHAEGWVQRATRHSVARKLADIQLRLAEAELASRRAERQPRVDAVLQAGHEDSSDYALGQRQDLQQAGAEIQLRPYSGGELEARTREAEARLDLARATWNQVTLETERLVRQRFGAVQSADASQRAFQQAYESAKAADMATAAGYEAGTRTLGDVLESTSRSLRARSERNQARLELLVGLLQLHAAAGTLEPDKVTAVDPFLFDRR